MTQLDRTFAVATGNAHKLQEFQEILGPLGWDVRSLKEWLPNVPEPDETEPDFAGNAALKALHALQVLERAGLDPARLPRWVVADDSGLEVAALGGEPGVFSARFADRAGRGSGDAANRAELVRRLQAIGLEGSQDTSAAFVCAIHAVDRTNPNRDLSGIGRCEGRVGLVERGNEGFGYDSLFRPILPGGELATGTFGELPSTAKHDLSHRGRALRDLAAKL